MNKTGDLILKKCRSRGLTQSKLSERMGQDRRNLNQQLRVQEDFKFQSAIEILQYLGYETILVETDYHKISEKYYQESVKNGDECGVFWLNRDGKFVVVDARDTKNIMEAEASTYEECRNKMLELLGK